MDCSDEPVPHSQHQWKMGRRAARKQTNAALRRSSRLRNIYSFSKETEDIHIGTSADQILKENEDEKSTEKKTEGEDSRKAGKPSSRIPTFQSSLTRKRTTTQIAESQLPLKPEGPTRECQMKERGISSGENLATKSPVFGDRETALPILSTRIHSHSTDDLSVAGTSDPIQSESSESTSIPHEGNQVSDPSDKEGLEEALHRPSLREESESHDKGSAAEPPAELQDASTEFQSKDKQQSHAVIQDNLEQKLSEFMQDIGDELKERLEKEIPPASILEDAQKQFLRLKDNKKLCVDGSPETFSKQNDVPARSQTGRSKAKPKHSTSTRAKSFALFCIFPSILLLLVGFGQHIWLYGVPRSVSHLLLQLELHWLEGFWLPQEECSSDCRLTLTESIPEGMLFPSGSPQLQSITHTWTNLLNRANSSVNIAAFYLTMSDSDIGLIDPSAMQGKVLLDHLKQLESRGVNLKIAVNAPQTYRADTDELTGTGAEIREVDLSNITGGIVHTKLWVVDKKHMYVGSANMDWRSLTQVKEVGVSVEDCSCLAQDAARIFGVYWELGAQKNSTLPPYWPGRFSALSSIKYPLTVKFNGVPARVYLSSAPPQLSASGRTDDLSAILSVIADAKKFIYVSVMDYLPISQYTPKTRFWPVIDSALRDAACARKVEVKLLVSCWSHSPKSMFIFLQSLSVLSKTPLGCNIHVKVFEVPCTSVQHQIPFARVNHAKFMVTDRVVYIGTSNWSENYFTQTAGVGLVVNQTGYVVEEGQQTVQNQLHKIFQRDWNSDFAQALTDDLVEHCSRRGKTL
ncbi:5'-3' exonuclease PLD3 isoform X1 [Tachysurus fulvidraco]|uniref:5'-3' exonuclease PLD3 isoform X1 n=2 Tax=Tachysurus fulvidraco TaxID=1234273 RepID=UPI001FEE2512|nr:5'-3' exonuclease PLD3 isoform X1 [Tachysurus fulvidraco]